MHINSRVCLSILAFAITLSTAISSSAQDVARDTIADILVLDHYDEDDGYIAYLPIQHQGEKLQLIVFLHGYGALNPMIFGGWVSHLVGQGFCVIYPRYQESMFRPAPTDFVPNTIAALQHFESHVRDQQLAIDLTSATYIGHSYGGVIAANIAAHYQEYGCPVPTAALICEPGTGPFTGAVLDSYEMIGQELLLVVVVGDHDATVGQAFGQKIYDTAINTPQRVLFWQYADRHLDEAVGSSHYEPYALDQRFDNGIENFTTNKALRVGRTDQVDHNGYWKILDQLLAKIHRNESTFTETEIRDLSKLGFWSDGTPLRNLDYFFPEALDSK